MTYTRLTEGQHIKASPQEIAAFLTLLEGSDFWKSPAPKAGTRPRRLHLDAGGHTETVNTTRSPASNPFVAAKFAATAPAWEKLGPERSYAEACSARPSHVSGLSAARPARSIDRISRKLPGIFRGWLHRFGNRPKDLCATRVASCSRQRPPPSLFCRKRISLLIGTGKTSRLR